MMIRFVALALVLLSACTTPTTKVGENRERRFKPAAAGEQLDAEAITITEQTVVLDARATFEHTLSHIPRAINLQWSDFTQQEANFRGVLLKDRFELTRRLARLGVSPESQVIVVGNGTSGRGEEGRLAWTLAYLGVNNVRSIPMSFYKGNVVNTESEPLQPVTLWKPITDETLIVNRDELVYCLDNRGVYEPISFADRKPRLYKILDVRSTREYLGKEGIGLNNRVPNMEAINVPWSEFFTVSGRPNPQMVARLHDVGVTREQRVIVISERGLRSAAVTMALRELGFNSAGNYAGGLQELVSGTGRPRRR